MNSLFEYIPKIGLGLAALGRPQYINVTGNKKKVPRDKSSFIKHAHEVLDSAYEMGVRYYDAARSYGIAEEILEEWRNSNPNKKDIIIGSKWGYSYVADWDAKANIHEVKEHSLKNLKRQWTLSKSLLPQLRLYQVHSATLESGILENRDVINELWKIKKTNQIQIGITTSGTNQNEIINLALSISKKKELLFDSYQVTYNILDQNLLNIYSKLADNKRIIIIKEALANGRLIPNNSYRHYQQLYRDLNILSKKYNVGSDAICLRFVLDTIQSDMVLSGANNKQHAFQNYKALDFKLTPKEITALKKHRITSSEYWNERSSLGWK